MGLLGQDGSALPLTLDGENETGPKAACWNCGRRVRLSSFVDVAEAPLLSLGQGFSAPAIFRTSLSRKDRAILMGADSDDFNRWEAGQALAADHDAGRRRAATRDYICGDWASPRQGGAAIPLSPRRC